MLGFLGVGTIAKNALINQRHWPPRARVQRGVGEIPSVRRGRERGRGRGEIKKSGSIIMGTKVSASRINEKIRQYANEFVLCQECGKPDTKIEKDGKFPFLKCQACGARQPLKSKV